MAEGFTVLVVDDEADVRWALSLILRRNGYAVATAGSGTEALQWLRKAPLLCHLILLDAKLTDMEGIALAQRIRSETSCLAPMILISGYFYEDDGLVQQTLTSGLLSDFVTKPFHHDALLHAINVALSPGSSATPEACSP